jgi:hypothetical protein
VAGEAGAADEGLVAAEYGIFNNLASIEVHAAAQ